MKKTWLMALLLVLPAVASAAPRSVLYPKSEIGFSVKQMGVAVSGVFRRYSASIDLDPAQPEKSRADIEIETASLSTGEAEADGEAVKKPWLDVPGFPKASFHSSSVRALAAGRYEAKGALSIKGKARELTIPFTLASQPDGSTLASGEFNIKRTDFGIGGGEWNEGDLVAQDIAIRFRLLLAK